MGPSQGRGGAWCPCVRPDGHCGAHPGLARRGQPGGSHQSWGDLPPAQGGEWGAQAGVCWWQPQHSPSSVLTLSLSRNAPAITWASSVSPQGVTHQQWYLFNDFLIEPIDKVSCDRFHFPLHPPFPWRPHPQYPGGCQADSGGRGGSSTVKASAELKSESCLLSDLG